MNLTYILMKKTTFIAMLLLLSAAAAAQPVAKVACGPYLQAVGEREFTVVWTTDNDAVAWVEVAPDDGTHFYGADRPRFWQSRNGRRTVGRLHSVRVTGLEPGTTYRYRIMQRGAESPGGYAMKYSRPTGSDVYMGEPFEITTLDPAKEKIAFAVVNDVHARDSLLRLHFADTPRGKYDFVLFNGDMSSYLRSEDDIFKSYMNSAVELFARETPLYFARGNHENRGIMATEFIDYFPTSTGAPYYLFRHGPAAILVIDGGEDKPDGDIDNLEIMDFTPYRRQVRAWLAEAVKSDAYRNAPVKIVVVHMPPASKGWHGEAEVHRLYVPLINEAGADLMLCGHTHSYALQDKSTDGCDFPVLINSNSHKLDIEVTARGIDVRILDGKGQLFKRLEFKK